MLLDSILENLTPVAKVEKPAAHRLARKLLHRCQKELHRPVNEFLQGCLPSAAAAEGGGAPPESGLRDEWPKLLVELTSVSLQLVSYVLPQLNEVFNIEDEALRLKGAELLPALLELTSAGRPRDSSTRLHCCLLPSAWLLALPALPLAGFRTLASRLLQTRRTAPSRRRLAARSSTASTRSCCPPSSRASPTSACPSALRPSSRACASRGRSRPSRRSC